MRIGARSDDEAYERGAEKRFASAGAEIKKYILPEDAKQEDLEILIRNLNVDSTIHGILLFRPLPDHMEESRIKQLIRMEKDVDGMSYAGPWRPARRQGGKNRILRSRVRRRP